MYIKCYSIEEEASGGQEINSKEMLLAASTQNVLHQKEYGIVHSLTLNIIWGNFSISFQNHTIMSST